MVNIGMRKKIIVKYCIIIFSLALLGTISFTTFALTSDSFGALFNGYVNVVSPDLKKPDMPQRQTVIITKDSTDIVIQSGYNYIFEGNQDWGSKDNPIDLNNYTVIKGTLDKPLDAYIDGGGYYFKLNLNYLQAPNGLLGVFSGAISNFNLYAGQIEPSSEAVVFASTLTKDGVIFNCENYVNASAYQGAAAGFVKVAEGLISKSVNYGKIDANSFAAGIAYSVKGKLVNCENYGEIESKNEQAAGIAWTVHGALNNCQNFGNILGNKGAAGIAVKADGAAINNCKNGLNNEKDKIKIKANSGPAAGIVFEAFNGSAIINCANYASINGRGAFGVCYSVIGNIIDTQNYGDMTSYQSSAGIADTVQGELTRVYNYGNIIADNTKASGLAHSVIGNINESHNLGQVSTIGGSAVGLVYEIKGNITDSSNSGIVQKTGWGNANVAGIACLAEGKIESVKNLGRIVVENTAQYVGGIAAVMKGQILNSSSEGKIAQNNEYQFAIIGGITAVLENVQGALIKDSRFIGGFEIKSKSANYHPIACNYPKGSIVNCSGMGIIYDL
ncbi:MAG TPA: hypothetical protein VIL24_03685 [Clostridia bacterium]